MAHLLTLAFHGVFPQVASFEEMERQVKAEAEAAREEKRRKYLSPSPGAPSEAVDDMSEPDTPRAGHADGESTWRQPSKRMHSRRPGGSVFCQITPTHRCLTTL